MPHEISEHIEHASHEHGPHANLARKIGITIAILGVLMALCSAQVGAARTDLIATMVKQNGAELRHQTVSNKLAMLIAELQQLHALLPDEKEFAKVEAELEKIDAEPKNSDTALLFKTTRREAKKILMTVTPTNDDMLHFVAVIEHNQEEAATAKEWAESYHDAVEAHFDTAARFEVAMLAAEIGIVIGSVSLLLSKQYWFAQTLWCIALVLGLVCVTVGGVTKYVNTQTLINAEKKIDLKMERYMEASTAKDGAADDAKLIEEVKKLKPGS
jgi:hypothetical protein